MSFEKQVKTTLDGFTEFKKKRDLVEITYIPYFIHWVTEFLYFAKDKTTLSFKQSRDFFINEVESRADIKSCTLNCQTME